MPRIGLLAAALVAILSLQALAENPAPSSQNMKPLFDGKTLDGWTAVPAGSWTVKDGAMASTGAGRGYIYTNEQFEHYRLIFTMRHVGVETGQKDHQAAVLFFCVTPPPEVDALGAIQFQPPNGSYWDYRKGHKNPEKELFTSQKHPRFDPHAWSRVELIVNAKNGTARMAVAQPPDAPAVEVLDFKDPSAGRKGPIAWQIHNKGLLDEYKDVRIELDPKSDDLITVGKK